MKNPQPTCREADALDMGIKGTIQIPPFALSQAAKSVKANLKPAPVSKPRPVAMATPKAKPQPEPAPAPQAKPPPVQKTADDTPAATPRRGSRKWVYASAGAGLILAALAVHQGWSPLNSPRNAPAMLAGPPEPGAVAPEPAPQAPTPKADAWNELFGGAPRQ